METKNTKAGSESLSHYNSLMNSWKYKLAGRLYSKIQKGELIAIYRTSNTFSIFEIDGTRLVNVTWLLNAIDKLPRRRDGYFWSDEELKKIPYKHKVTLCGCGYDKAGSFLGGIARKLQSLKPFKTLKCDLLKRGCDASYQRLSL